MDAPERIWLDWPGANKGEPVYDEPPEREEQAGQIGYIRLDVHEAALAAARAEGMRMRDALHQALTYVEADEVAHGRQFGTGNAIRAAIAAIPEDAP